MRKVLIVEDDQAMAVALRDGFTYEGDAVQVARDGATGLGMATEKGHDLVILDVMLPRMSGLDVCRQLRSAGNPTPIIMLTARGQEIDKVLGLKTGADDYVTKPFSFLELMARVEAVLRRGGQLQVVRGVEGRAGAGLKPARVQDVEVFRRAPRRGRDARPTARPRVGLRGVAADAHR